MSTIIPPTTTPSVEIISFGHRHPRTRQEIADLESAHLKVDLRRHFHGRQVDPDANPDLRHLTAYDEEIRQAVLSVPGIGDLIESIAQTVRAYLDRSSAGPVKVAIGCSAGRHRAPTVAMEVARTLKESSVSTTVTHLDLDEQCVFCQIVDGCAPAKIVREWPEAIAIVPLGPVVPGHLLVIPRTHVDDFTADPQVSAATMRRAAELGGELGGAMNLITSKGWEATQSVFHLHIHLVPRTAGDGLRLPWTGQEPARPR